MYSVGDEQGGGEHLLCPLGSWDVTSRVMRRKDCHQWLMLNNGLEGGGYEAGWKHPPGMWAVVMVVSLWMLLRGLG